MFYPKYVVAIAAADGSKVRHVDVTASNKFRAEDVVRANDLQPGETIVKTVRKHPKRKV